MTLRLHGREAKDFICLAAIAGLVGMRRLWNKTGAWSLVLPVFCSGPDCGAPTWPPALTGCSCPRCARIGWSVTALARNWSKPMWIAARIRANPWRRPTAIHLGSEKLWPSGRTRARSDRQPVPAHRSRARFFAIVDAQLVAARSGDRHRADAGQRPAECEGWPDRDDSGTTLHCSSLTPLTAWRSTLLCRPK